MCRNVNVCASVYSVAKQMRWAFGDITHAFGLAPVARPCRCCRRPHRSDPRPCPRPHRFISSSRSRGFNAERPCHPRLRSRPRRPRPRLGPVWSRRCCLLLSALPLTAQPGHCRPPALSLSPSALPLACMYIYIYEYIYITAAQHQRRSSSSCCSGTDNGGYLARIGNSKSSRDAGATLNTRINMHTTLVLT